MKYSFFSVLAMTLIIQTYAQSKISVYTPSTNATRICPTLDSAYNSAVGGDYIYLPAGSFSFSNPIQKKLYIFGTGHNPDSTIATGRTLITGSVILQQGADSGLITGCYLTGSGSFYNQGQIYFNDNINGYSITRCYIYGGISGNSSFLQQNIIIKENTVGSYSVCFTCSNPYSVNFSNLNTNNQILNNIFFSKVSISNGIIKNNIWLNNYNFDSPLYASNSTISDNIFKYFGNSCSGCFFYNNINAGVNGTDGNGNQGNNNTYLSDPIDSLFVNYNSNVGWNYTSNFHLISGSPYINGGSDGTDIGIYGGLYPWKEGSIPSNPHISLKSVAPQNNAAGMLNATFIIKPQSY